MLQYKGQWGGGRERGGEGEGQDCSNTPIETDLSFSSIDL